MILGRLFHRTKHGATGDVEEQVIEIDAAELSRMFSAPRWLRDLGLLAWFLVGVGVVLAGSVWLFAQISTITIPVLVGGIIATVAGPIVARLQRHKVPRAAGAAIVLLGVIALAVLIIALVIGGLFEQSDQIKTLASQALDKIERWFNDAGANGTSSSKQEVSNAVPDIGKTLLHGVAGGIKGLTSLAFFLSFTAFSIFFLLKDGPRIRAFIDRNLGVPLPVATTITSRTIFSLRRYFLGLTIVAAFNGVVVGLGALVLDVPWPERSRSSPSPSPTSPSSARSSRAPSR